MQKKDKTEYHPFVARLAHLVLQLRTVCLALFFSVITGSLQTAYRYIPRLPPCLWSDLIDALQPQVRPGAASKEVTLPLINKLYFDTWAKRISGNLGALCPCAVQSHQRLHGAA